MIWIIQNTTTGDFREVETDDPEGYISQTGLWGYVYSPALILPVVPARDPLAQVEADKVFGLALIDSFVAGSRANGFNLAETRAINAILGEVELLLRRGSVQIARDALAEIDPSPLFSQKVKNDYLAQIDNYLNS